jgi:DNA-binding transcriptional LysR family regulator
MDRIVAAKAFIGVAELGSFSGAARAQGVSPSLITKYIQGLEQSLGTTLFQRSTRKVVLTEAGNVYKQHWRRILSDIEAADAAIGMEQNAVKGTLRIGTPAAFGRIVVAPLAVSFSREYPEVGIDLVFNNYIVDPMTNNLDIVFRVGDGRGGDQTSITARRLASFPRIVCASPAYIDRHGVPLSLNDLCEHVCVHRVKGEHGNSATWDFMRDGETVRIPIDGRIRANTADAVISAGLHGQGLIYQPAYLVRDYLQTGQLRAIALDAHPVEVPLAALWQTDKHIPARVRAFIDYCALELRGLR